MIKYFKMKRQEWALKSMFYGVVLKLIEEQEDIIGMIQKMYTALKGVSAEEMQDKMISALAEIIHAENQKEKVKSNE